MAAPFRLSRALALVPLAFAAVLPAAAAPRSGSPQTALDRYVAKPDSAYSYRLVRTTKVPGATQYLLSLVSQEWRTSADLDRTKWEHWLTIIQPDEVRTSTGLLLIAGGSIASSPPSGTDPFLTQMAVETHSVFAELRMVPNEPVTFKDETKSRNEDGIIAYTWDRFLKTGDETWPLRLPMTKSAVRAMDTVTAFCGEQAQGRTKVEKFVVAGASKRGWTTWTTAAVDDRVVAIVPLVIDVLNVSPTMEHHYRAYGFWAPAVGDYTALRLMERRDDPRYGELLKIEDPYSYRRRLTMPKLLINSAGDQFFLPDSSQFYWDGLKGEKHLRYIPNTDHGLRGTERAETLAAFYAGILSGRPRPRYTWKLEKDGSIRVETKDAPSQVVLWQATNPKARDFRLEAIGPAYTSTPLTEVKKGVYVARVSQPAQGWTAFFVEMTFPSGGPFPYKLTSGVRVVPDTLPFPPPPTAGKAAPEK